MMGKVYFFLILLVAPVAAHAQSVQQHEKLKILNRYFELYNDHQVDKLVQMVAEDFTMYSLEGDYMSVEISGRAGLEKWFRSYFKNLPKVRSEISALSRAGKYISFKETAYWGDGKSQSSLAVYEIADNKIRRVWYYY